MSNLSDVDVTELGVGAVQIRHDSVQFEPMPARASISIGRGIPPFLQMR